MKFKLIIKTLNLFRFIVFNLLNLIITRFPQKQQPNSLLLIRLDSIGDYILARNFFKSLKESNIYSNYKITFCGNIILKEFAETIDAEIFDSFIWVDRIKFSRNIIYVFKLLKQVYQSGFETVIETEYSREILFGDSIVKISQALNKIGSKGSIEKDTKWKRNLLTDKYYTSIIKPSQNNLFEFYRNKEFFEILLSEKIELVKPTINVEKIKYDLPIANEFIVLFPGAQNEKRVWSYHNFISIIQSIICETKFDIVIAGSLNDKSTAENIITTINSNRIFDMTGKTSLAQLAKLISKCKALISNETSAVHFSAAVSAPFVCISNGNHLGRFNPYPVEMKIKCRYVYPTEIDEHISTSSVKNEKYRFNSEIDINSINPVRVYEAFKELL